jgi:hypothetical protein
MRELATLAWKGRFGGTGQFPGQWQQPIAQLEKQGAAAWIVAHADLCCPCLALSSYSTPERQPPP